MSTEPLGPGPTSADGLYDYAKRPPRLPAPVDEANDQLDISIDTRLWLYETQQVIRQIEQRAHDLFLQNLVKGTSHLSPGMEVRRSGARRRTCRSRQLRPSRTWPYRRLSASSRPSVR